MKLLASTRAVLAATAWLAAVSPAAAQAPAQPPPVRSEAPPRATPAAPSRPPLPPLTDDAQRLLDQWKQDQYGKFDGSFRLARVAK